VKIIKSEKKSSVQYINIIVLLIVFGIGVYFLFLRNNNDTDDQDPSSNAGLHDENGTPDNNEVDEAWQIDEPVLPIVENVTGIEQAQAVQTLKEQGFVVEIEERFNNDFEAGYVISQTPAAGSPEAPQSTIKLVVSLGPRVSRLAIGYDGRRTTLINIEPGDTIPISAIITPSNAVADVTWSSDNSRIVRVVPEIDGTTALVHGWETGRAIITANVGNIYAFLEVRVFYNEPLPGTRIKEMHDQLDNRDASVSLEFTWTSGHYIGQTVQLKRERDSNEWFLHKTDGDVIEVFPEFEYDGSFYRFRYLVSLPGEGSAGFDTYALYEHGVGQFIDSFRLHYYDFKWEFHFD